MGARFKNFFIVSRTNSRNGFICKASASGFAESLETFQGIVSNEEQRNISESQPGFFRKV
jgi:hypothetical protein